MLAPRPRAPLRLAVLHAQRTWAELLECFFRAESVVDVVVAHTSWEWVRGAVARGDVDVALVGVGGDGGFGPEHVRELRELSPGLAVVALSEATDRELLTATVRAGARGWVRPTTSARELLQVLHGVADGETWLPPKLSTVLLDSLLADERTRVSADSAAAKLSTRELEILDCLARGMTRPEIGELYRLSPHTVRTHINHILRKLGVHSTLAAVSLVHKTGSRR